ncbi:hypothetical protein [Pleurocapsa sp. FMAR1]|uniref:hypothetical protein n=1 Tax=Pleurocapsa sp. FMAR1 TaxID=3040204 RepID=UPI0029C756E6|nr:hypothetical protein [Pleurocapsa sp. FMAR1]
MKNFTVTNSNASGNGSLSAAILAANENPGFDNISIEVGNIFLNSALTISDSVNITGAGTVITQTGRDRIFNINDNNDAIDIDVTLNSLKLTGGSPVETGGAIFSYENLFIIDSQLYGNNTAKRGGAVYVEGANLNVVNSSIHSNKIVVVDQGASSGGGLYVKNGI